MAKKANTANFVEFYLMWGLVNGWQIPDFHITVCEWLEDFVNGNLKLTPFTLKQQSKIDPFDDLLRLNLWLNSYSLFIF